MRKSRRKNITHYLAVAWIAVVSVGIAFIFGGLHFAMVANGHYL